MRSINQLIKVATVEIFILKNPIFVGGTTWQFKFNFQGKIIFIGGTTTKIRILMKISELQYVIMKRDMYPCICNSDYKITK